MRFAQSACKFDRLHLCPLFFYDLWSLFGASSLNVAKDKKNLENDKNGLELHHSRVPQEALQKATLMNGGCGSIKGAHLEYLWIFN